MHLTKSTFTRRQLRAGRSGTLLLSALVLSACGGSSPTAPPASQNPGTSTPAPQTFTLQGQVTEAEPFTSTRIAGASVQIADGPNAGRSTTTDASGNYVLSSLSASGFTVRVTANGYQAQAVGITLTGNTTRNFQLQPSGPRTQFGSGQWRVGRDIKAGRYFADPPRSGCYWERQSGLSGEFDDIIANDFIGYNSAQVIVDISGSDVAFEADADCGTWYSTPRHGLQSTIAPGTWLVGRQVTAGTYRANVSSGCYWERLSGFSGQLKDIRANDFVASAGQRFVSILSNDLGFSTDADCGTWSRTSAVHTDVANGSASSSIAHNREMNRAQEGR